MARSVADVVSAHGLSEQVPRIPAGDRGSNMIGIRKQQSCSLLHARTSLQTESTKLSGDMGSVLPETVSDRDVAPEPPWMGSWRVSGGTPPMSPRID